MPHSKIHYPRIVLVAGLILIIVSLLVGVSVFMVMQRHAEGLFDKSLQLSLQSRMQLTEAEIRAGFGRTTVAATRPRLIDLVQRLNSDADDAAARTILNEVALSFLPTGLTAIAVFDKAGRELTRAGAFTQKSMLTVPLNLPGRVQLMWDGKLLLHAVLEFNQAGQVVGKVVTQTSLPSTTAALKDASRLGKSGEMVLCALFGPTMQCFPSTLNLNAMTIPRVASNGNLLPMAHALAGKTGFVSAQDYRRQEVEAAYAPVGDLGLGMVLKVDAADLYAPVWQQLRFVIPLLLGVLVIGLLSLRWLLTPLVLRLVRSEAKVSGLNAVLEKRVKKRTAQLEASNHDLQQFAFVASHDLKTPLRSISGFVQLLEQKYADKLDDSGLSLIHRTAKAARRLEQLTDDLLTYARVGAETKPLAEVNCNEVASDVADLLDASLKQSGAVLCFGELPRVMADRAQLTQLFLNLVSNAIKYCQGRTPVVKVSASKKDGQWLFSVADNGIGVESQYFGKIFEVFKRLHTQKEYPGTGIGLAVCRRVVERHGGAIWLESALDQGSTFYFTLPEIPAESAAS